MAEVIGYRAAHKRVEAEHGPAWMHECQECGNEAAEWAYNGLDSDELETPEGLAYSTAPDFYVPLCIPCHRDRDRAARERRQRGAGLGVEWTPLGDSGLSVTGAPEAIWGARRRWREGLGLHDEPLSDVRQLLGMMITPQSEADLNIVTLWIAATHLSAQRVGHYSPRLAIVAPSYGAGKSTLLEYVAKLSHEGRKIDGGVTDALIPRFLQANGLTTLAFDEVEKTLRPENRNAMAVLNNGWKRGSTTEVLDSVDGGGWGPTRIDLFAPVALAGNGLRLPEDVRQRFVTVRLTRSENPTLTDWEALDPVLERLRVRLAEWAEDAAKDVRVKRPKVPEGVKGRDRDRWSVLLSAARGAGGRWLEPARALALGDAAERAAEAEALGVAPNEQLAYDLITAWEADGSGERAPRMPTRRLIERLTLANPELWGPSSAKPLTEMGLGGKLRQFYGVHPIRWREGSAKVRGYALADIRAKVWASYRIGDQSSFS